MALLVTTGGCGRSSQRGDPVPAGSRATDTSPTHAATGHGGAHERVRFVPLAPRERGGPNLFVEVDPRHSGVAFVNELDPQHVDRRLYHSGFACGGVAIGDVDGDGRPDLFFTSGPGQNRLYLQHDVLQFRDATQSAGLEGLEAWSTGAAMADVDNDGDLDIYVANYDAPNWLFVNDGTGHFREAAEELGLDLVDASLMPAFCDYDRDGRLDVYLLTNRYYQRGGRPKKPPIDLSTNPPQILPEYRRFYGFRRLSANHYGVDSTGRPDLLLRQGPDGTFRDVSATAGIEGVGHGLSATWWDFDSDGWSDLYVANDFDDPDRLYRNKGDGTFVDVLATAFPYTSWFSMGSDVADLDGDGRLDLVVADMSPTSHAGRMTTMGSLQPREMARVVGPPPQYMRNMLYLNTGGGRLTEAAELAGIADTDWTWAVILDDFDHDGRPDALFCNGVSRNFNNNDVPMTPEMLVGKTEWDYHAELPARPERNLAFRNAGNLQFDEIGNEWGFQKLGMSYAAARGDLDRDGDLDLVVANLDENVSIYRNEVAEGNSLVVRLIGTTSNRFGVGATLEVICRGDTLVDQLNPFTGYMSSNEPIVHIGLGDAQRVEKLTVRWPSGTVQHLEDIPANVLVEVTEPAAAPSVPARTATEAALFVASDHFRGALHEEQPYEDFRQQHLLSRKLSQLGPGMAVADVDADGDDDVYLGGAAGFPGQLLISDQGRAVAAEVPDFVADRACEDMGALWLDVDADGDLDLYVVSGGVESPAGAEALRDRLYLNEGGKLRRAPRDALPDLRDSGSAVVAADFDRDGDLDLFVGSRVVPGGYPRSSSSRVLENIGGRFVDATMDKAPELSHAGMVTGALWTDVDGDRWLDLFVTTDWGPVRLYRNAEGTLREETASAGLAELNGWWNGIAGQDWDADGDIDYVATNFGENTQYHPTPDRPLVLFYGDFEGSGNRSLVEATFENNRLLPMRDKYALEEALPLVAERFSTHRAYAEADVEEIFGAESLDEASRYEVQTLQSSVLINDGTGRFTVRPLPPEAQLFPAFGILTGDWNGDANVDLYLSGNFASAHGSLAPMNGGLSQLLIGDGEGGFRAVPPRHSGLLVPQDARSAARGDFDGDGHQELLLGINNGPLLCFAADRRSIAQTSTLQVLLDGHERNPTAVGALVSAFTRQGKRQVAEVYAGGGYLSQSPSSVHFTLPKDDQWHRVEVQWPDGTASAHELSSDSIEDGRVTLAGPEG